MAPKKKASVEYTSLSGAALRRLSQQFADISRRYSEIAKAVDDLPGGGEIKVKGIATLNHAIKRINGSLSSADSALLAAQFKAWGDKEADADVAAMEAKVAKARKKKP